MAPTAIDDNQSQQRPAETSIDYSKTEVSMIEAVVSSQPNKRMLVQIFRLSSLFYTRPATGPPGIQA